MNRESSGRNHEDHSSGNQEHRLGSRKHPTEEGPSEGWLVSYADMMTLLFGFFVLLFSMSSVDQKKYDELQKTAAKQFKSKTEYHSPAEDVAKDITDRLIKSGLKMEDVELKQTLDGIQISMRGTTFFESGKTNLLPKGAKFIDEVGQSIIQASLPYEVRVEGHTDDVPISGPVFSSNWDLSSARASGVVQQLEFKGIASNRLVAMGYGDSRPLVPNRSPEGVPILENRAKNRRVVISISFFGSK